jgi:hypothetical protein
MGDIFMTKQCKLCKIHKDLEAFQKDTSYSCGYKARCKECVAPIDRQRARDSKERRKLYFKQYAIDNKEKVTQKSLGWRQNNADKLKRKYQANKEEAKRKSKLNREANKQRNKETRKRYLADLASKGLCYRHPTSPAKTKGHCSLCQLKNNLRCGISFRRTYKKNKRTEKHIGCTMSDLRVYIAAKFKDGMTWENYGKSSNGRHWVVDHIVPLATAQDEESYIKLWHYSNLQPLWEDENAKKSSWHEGFYF